ncbi:peptidoglycan binding [Homalodisca vitripennis]|nr:peptidoglycan binding [Homalodisca vitripennis]
MGLNDDARRSCEDLEADDGNTDPLLGRGQQLSTYAGSSSSSLDVHEATYPPSIVPMRIDSLVVNPSDDGHSKNVVVHIGDDNKVNVNHIFVCSKDRSEYSEFSDSAKTDIERTIAEVISKSCSAKVRPQDSLVTHNRESGASPEGKSGLQSKLFYWVIILVALSASACVLLAVVSAVKNRFIGALSDGGLWWLTMMGGVIVSLSCINLVTNVVFSVNRLLTMYSQHSDKNNSLPENMPDGPRLMVRWRWGAQPAGYIDDNTLPIKRVVIIHTASEELLATPKCIHYVRQVQSVHMEGRGWSDIAYNFLIGGDGSVFVGRDWDKVGAHTKSNNIGTLGIAFIGTFIDRMPNNYQLEALNKLLEQGLKLKKLSEDYKIVAQCQLQVTASPGRMFVEELRSWPRFDSSLPFNFGDTP